MSKVNQIEQSRITQIEQLMEDIEIETDCTPTMIGAINLVATSGKEPSEEGVKLLILEDRGMIDTDEYLDLAEHFARHSQ